MPPTGLLQWKPWGIACIQLQGSPDAAGNYRDHTANGLEITTSRPGTGCSGAGISPNGDWTPILRALFSIVVPRNLAQVELELPLFPFEIFCNRAGIQRECSRN